MKKLYTLLFFLSIATSSYAQDRLLDNLTATSTNDQVYTISQIATISFTKNGNKMIVLTDGSLSERKLQQTYSIENLEHISQVGEELLDGVISGDFSSNGSYLFYNTANKLYRVPLNLANEISTLDFESNQVQSIDLDPSDIYEDFTDFSLSEDGKDLVLINSSNALHIEMDNAFDLGDISSSTIVLPNITDFTITTLAIAADGKRLLLSGNKTNTSDNNISIYEYALTTAYDFSTIVAAGGVQLAGIRDQFTPQLTLAKDALLFINDGDRDIYRFLLDPTLDISPPEFSVSKGSINYTEDFDTILAQEDSYTAGTFTITSAGDQAATEVVTYFEADGITPIAAANFATAIAAGGKYFVRYTVTDASPIENTTTITETVWSEVQFLGYVSSPNQELSFTIPKLNSFTFFDAGNKLLLLDTQNQKLYQYQLASPYTIEGATRIGDPIDVSSKNMRDMAISADGNTLFFTDNSGKFYEAPLSTANDLTGLELVAETEFVLSEYTIENYTKFLFSEDGKNLVFNNNNKALHIVLSNGFDLSSLASTQETDLPQIEGHSGLVELTFSSDGSRALLSFNIYVNEYVDIQPHLYEYELQTAYDLSSTSRIPLASRLITGDNKSIVNMALIGDDLLFIAHNAEVEMDRYVVNAAIDDTPPTFTVTKGSEPYTEDFTTELNPEEDTYIEGEITDASDTFGIASQEVTYFEADGITSITAANFATAIEQPGTYIIKYTVTDANENTNTIQETLTVQYVSILLDKISNSPDQQSRPEDQTILFTRDGKKMIHLYQFGYFYEYKLEQPFSIENAEEIFNGDNVPSLNGVESGDLSSNGNYLFYNTANKLYRVPLSTANEIRPSDFESDQVQSIDLDPSDIYEDFTDFSLSEDGHHLVLINNSHALYIEMTTAFDLGNSSSSTTALPNITDFTITTLAIAADGKRLLLSGDKSDISEFIIYIYEYVLTTAYDFSTIVTVPVKEVQLAGVKDNHTPQLILVKDALLFIHNRDDNMFRFLLDPTFDISPPTFTVTKGSETAPYAEDFTTVLEPRGTYTAGTFTDKYDATGYTSGEVSYYAADGTTPITSFNNMQPALGTYIIKYTLTDTSSIENFSIIQETLTVQYASILLDKISNSPDQRNEFEDQTILFTRDGKKMIYLFYDDYDYFYEYKLEQPFSIENREEIFNGENVPSLNGVESGDLSSNGNYLFYNTANKLYRIPLSTANEISTLDFESDQVQSIDLTENFTDFSLSEDGHHLVLINSSNALHIEMNTAFDLGDTSSSTTVLPNITNFTITTLAIAADGKRLLLSGDNGDILDNMYIYEYALATAYDFSTIVTVPVKEVQLAGIRDRYTPQLTLAKDALLFINDKYEDVFRFLLDPTLDISPPTFTVTKGSELYTEDFTTSLPVGANFTEGAFTGQNDATGYTPGEVSYYAADGTTPIASFNNMQPVLGTYIIKYTLTDTSSIENFSIIQETLTVISAEPHLIANISQSSGQESNIQSFNYFTFSHDGMQLFGTQSGKLYQYQLASPYYINGALQPPVIINISGIQDIDFSHDGAYFYYVVSGDLYKEQLAAPYDITNRSTNTSQILNATTYSDSSEVYKGFKFSEDGEKLFFYNSDYILQLELNAPFDVVNLTGITKTEILFNDFIDGEDEGLIRDIAFSNDGHRVVINNNGFRVYEFYLITAYDLSSTSRILLGDKEGKSTSNTMRGMQLINDQILFISNFDTNALDIYLIDSNIIYEAPTFTVTKASETEPYTEDFTTTIAVGETYSKGTITIPEEEITTNITYFQDDGITELTADLHDTQPVKGTYIIKYTATVNTNSVFPISTVIQETLDVADYLTLFTNKITTTDQEFNVQRLKYFIFSDDGMQLFGTQNSKLYQYQLASPYDINSATQVEIETVSNIQDIAFSDNGNYFYYIAGNTLYKEQLVTPYDITNRTEIGNLSVTDLSTHSQTYSTFSFSENGDKLFFVNSQYVLQLGLTSAYDLATVEPTSINEIKFSEEPLSVVGLVRDIAFSQDGYRVLINTNNSKIHEYYVPEAYDISEIHETYKGSKEMYDMRAMQFVDDQVLFVWDYLSSSLKRYLLNENIDLDLPTFSLTKGNETKQEDFTTYLPVGSNFTEGIIQDATDETSGIASQSITYYAADGVSIIDSFAGTAPAQGTYIVKYTVTDASSLEHSTTIEETVIVPITQFVDKLSSSDQSATFDLAYQSFAFSADGKKLTLLNPGSKELFQYELPSSYNIEHATQTKDSIALTSISDNPKRIAFSNNGTSLFLSSDGNQLHQIPLASAYTITSTDIENTNIKTLNLSGHTSQNYDVFHFSQDGTQLIFVNDTNALQFSLSEGFNLDEATTPTEFSMPAIGSIRAFTFSTDGTRVLLTGHNNNALYEYLLQDPYNLSENSRVFVGTYNAPESYETEDILLINDDVFFTLERTTKTLYRYVIDPDVDLNPPSFTVAKGSITYSEDFSTTLQSGEVYAKGAIQYINDRSSTTTNTTYFEADGTTVRSTLNGQIPEPGTYIIQYTVTDTASYENATSIKETLHIIPAPRFLNRINKLTQTFFHDKKYSSFAFSDDGNKLIAALLVDQMNVYDLSNAYKINNITTPSEEWTTVAKRKDIFLSNDGLFYAVLDDDRVLTGVELTESLDFTTVNVSSLKTLDLSEDILDTGDEILDIPYLGFTFSADGKKIIFVNKAYVLQITLGTAYDLSSVNDRTEFEISFEKDEDIQAITFSSDGKSALITGEQNLLYEFYLQEAYDLSDDSRILVTSVDIGHSGIRDIHLLEGATDDKDKLFVLDFDSKKLYKYSVNSSLDEVAPIFTVENHNGSHTGNFTTALQLGETYTAGNIVETLGNTSLTTSTINYFYADGITPLASVDGTVPQAVTFIVKYTLTDVSTTSLSTSITETVVVAPTAEFIDKIDLNTKTQEFGLNSLRSFAFSTDGMQLLMLRGGAGQMFQYRLDSPYDISTKSGNGSLASLKDLNDATIPVRRIAFSPNGSHLFLSTTDNKFYKAPLATAYDITSINTTNMSELDLTLHTAETYLAFSFSADGTALIFINNTNSLRFTLADGFNLATASLATAEFSMPSIGSVQGISFSSDGKRVLISRDDEDQGDENNNDVYEYYLQTPYDLSENSRVLAATIDLTDSDNNTNSRSIQLINDELLFVTDFSTGALYQYNLSDKIQLSAKVILQGAYEQDSFLMSDELRYANVLNITSPYADALTAEATAFSDKEILDNDIVDWVYITLTNSGGTIEEQTSALLQRDGHVVATDGLSPLSFEILPGDYFITISHRNHLEISTASTHALSLGINNAINFTEDTSLVKGGSNAIEALDTGIYGMIAGDTNADKVTNTIDVAGIIVKASENLIAGYYIEDLNLDGLVNDTDTNLAKTTVGKAVQK